MSAMWLALGVGVAGAVGAGARYLVANWVEQWWMRAFPIATFFINVSGAFALGLTATAFATPATATTRVLLGAGFLGGFTTFSALSYETLALARRGKPSQAWLNVIVSLVAGLAAAALGLWLGAAL